MQSSIKCLQNNCHIFSFGWKEWPGYSLKHFLERKIISMEVIWVWNDVHWNMLFLSLHACCCFFHLSHASSSCLPLLFPVLLPVSTSTLTKLMSWIYLWFPLYLGSPWPSPPLPFFPTLFGHSLWILTPVSEDPGLDYPLLPIPVETTSNPVSHNEIRQRQWLALIKSSFVSHHLRLNPTHEGSWH